MTRLFNFALAATALLAASPALALPLSGSVQTVQPEPEPLMPEARRAAVDTHEQRTNAWTEWVAPHTHEQRRGVWSEWATADTHEHRRGAWSEWGAPDAHEQRRSEPLVPIVDVDAAGSTLVDSRHARDRRSEPSVPSVRTKAAPSARDVQLVDSRHARD